MESVVERTAQLLTFFSIVIPAHNEEEYIGSTLVHLKALEYPKDAYEVIVVENGSSDATYDTALKYQEDAIRIYSCPEPGVSKARNYGAKLVRSDADWVLFLDADTFVDRNFLSSLHMFLNSKTDTGYVAGTTQLMPYPATLPMRVLYGCTNIAFRVTRSAYGGAFLIKRELLNVLSFDELVQVGEDRNLSKEARAHGKFFFFSTKLVHTSTRRFQNGGWKRIPTWVGMWLFAGIISPNGLASSLQRSFKYKVIR